MALSTQTVVSDGTLTELYVALDYIDRSMVSVYFDGVLSPKTSGMWAWSGATSKVMRFTPAVADKVVVTLKRATPTDKLVHKFSEGAQFRPDTLDEGFKQILHVAQEFSEATGVPSDDIPMPLGVVPSAGFSNKFARADHVHVGGFGAGGLGSVNLYTFNGDGTKTTFALGENPTSLASTQVYVDGQYQQKSAYTLDGCYIILTEAPAAGTANVEVVVVTTGAGKANTLAFDQTTEVPQAEAGATTQSVLAWLGKFVQNGVGAVARKIHDKLRDHVSVKDFGAKGDGATDDTAAFTAARTKTAGRYLIPSGTYVLADTPDVFADPFFAGDNVTLIIGGVSYNVSNAFCGALRYRTDSPVLTSIVHAKTGNVLMQFQNGAAGTATYFYRGLSVQTDSHWVQMGPSTATGSVDMLWQRSAAHPTDPGGNRFNTTFESGNDRLLHNVATTASGAPSFDSYMRVWGGTAPKIDFPAYAPCFRQGWTMQDRAETGYKLAWVIGTDRHHIKDAAGTFTHMTFKADGSVGFFGAGGITRPTITGSRGGNAALASLLSQLNLMGLITDGTTA